MRIDSGKVSFRVMMILVVFSIIMTSVSCKHDKAAEVQPSLNLPDVVHFSSDIIPIFNASCNSASCHSGSGTVHLNLSPAVAYSQLFSRQDIDTINPSVSVLYVSMNSVSPSMPPSGRLSDFDVALVLKWIEQKAHNN